MYRTPKALAALAAAVALFSAACATQPQTGASTGAPERPGITPTAGAAPAPTRPAPTATTAAAPTTTTPPAGTTPAAPVSPTAAASPAAGSPTAAAASPTAASGGNGAAAGDPARGRAKFTGDAGCSACHGDKAQGNVFPGALKLSGTALTFDQFKAQVRQPRDPSKGMPPFSPAQVSDQDLTNIYAWLKTNP